MAVKPTDGVRHLSELPWPQSVAGLIGLPIVVGDVEVGRVRDVLLNKDLGHVLGFSVVGRGAHVHFLPWLAAEIGPGAVVARSVYALLSPTELAVYAEHGVALRAEVPRQGDRRVVDILVEHEGDVARVVLGGGEEPSRRAAGARTSRRAP